MHLTDAVPTATSTPTTAGPGNGPLLPKPQPQPGPSPDSTAPWIPPLDIVIAQARRTVADVDRIGYDADATTAVWHMHGTAHVLRMLLAALDADQAKAGQQAAA